MRNAINQLLSALQAVLKDIEATGTVPTSMDVAGETHGLIWDYDNDQDEPYVIIGYNLPNDTFVFAEIESGTYGQLQGIRVYYEANGFYN